MYPELQKELETFERRTPKSAEAHKRNLKRLPLGVASNYRAYDPYPIFVKEGQGSHFRDLDGNDYVDHNLCFGALMAGHCHPAVMKAVEKRLSTGTMFGMPHDMEWQLAEEICKRFPVEMVRFGSSGTEATMHAVRLGARRNRPRQDPQVRRRVSRPARRGPGQREAARARLRRHQEPDLCSGWTGRPQGFHRQRADCDLQ